MILEDNVLHEIKQIILKENISSCLINLKGHSIIQYYQNQKMTEKLYNINSITKSVLSILIGIAIDRGELEGTHIPISNYFPIISQDKKNITIEHLLTMSPGFEWGEFGKWGGKPTPMIDSEDWVDFILKREMEQNPGEKMYYNSGCSHLLSAILQKVTNEKTATYAEKVLFEPLNITNFRWFDDPKGISIGGFGLQLKSEDLLKIGELMLRKGKWQNNQIVSETWVTSSTTPKLHTYDDIGTYGYHWWILLDENRKVYNRSIYFAMGYGGQYIIISPLHELVVVFTRHKYKNTFGPNGLLGFFRETILKGISN